MGTRTVFIAGALLQLASAFDLGSCNPACCAPGVCVEPDSKYKRVLQIKPRQQWNIAGGFCGSLSIQVLMMGLGAWVSEDLIRKANIGAPCFGHQESGRGCEVGPENYADTAKGLRLNADVWDYMRPKPQAKAFKAWIKSHLVQGHPVMWAPMEKGGYPHQPYGPRSTPGGGAFNHHEPIVGIGSNHDLSDEVVYDDDWLLHHSNQDLMPYYRTFGSLQDDLNMNGNCQNASTSAPNREAYPCFYEQVAYGMAATGFDTNASVLAVHIDVDKQQEPNVRLMEKPINLHATVTVRGLVPGKSYILYRYEGFNSFPSADLEEGYDRKVKFVAATEEWTYDDADSFLSDGALYYMAAADDAKTLLI
eukprot:TRINITY_DN46239_c0_g1_i1.p1 TRINITY_DN46239_c0_g1~~TRINITY_DN46239_c0_g1_i1.p1  ORF type:complete len:380 (+),score=36.01 TRINITY_DN46239_c0_g1_i1:52-1140(+)